MKLDAVFAGAGCRGVGYVGALLGLEQRFGPLEFQHLGGTSAGAITAAILATGKKPADLLRILGTTNFNKFRDGRGIVLMKSWDFFVHAGLYRGDSFEKWMGGAVGHLTMGQTEIPLSVVTFDVRNRELVVISSESHPDLPIAKACRMSMSIPAAFRAVNWKDGEKQRVCVDGGPLLNYPVELFDKPGIPRWPTFGFFMIDETPSTCDASNGLEVIASLTAAIADAQMKLLTFHNSYRSIGILDGGVSTMDFGMSDEKKHKLVANGKKAAQTFAEGWNFDRYKTLFRGAEVQPGKASA